MLPSLELRTLHDELTQTMVRKHPLWMRVLACDGIFEAILLEVLLRCLLLERMAAWQNNGVGHDFLSKEIDT